MCFSCFSVFKDSNYIQEALSDHFILQQLVFYADVIYLAYCTIVFYC